MWRRLIAEALGSFLLTLSISVSHFGLINVPGTYYSAYATAGSVVTIMMMTGFISGAKFNPAITIGHLVSQTLSVKVQKEDIIEHVLYVLVQMIAAIPAAFLGWALNRGSMYFDTPGESSTADAFFAELVYSTLIVGVALMLGKMNDSIIIGTVGLGVAYFGGILAVGLISGGCFNPALGLAVNLAHYAAHRTHMDRLWVYLIAPTLGGAIGGVLNTVFVSELKAQKRSRVEPSS
jgi:aquaporin Z